jgi:hypothetical protein
MPNVMVEKKDVCLVEYVALLVGLKIIMESHQILSFMVTSQMLRMCICKLLQLIFELLGLVLLLQQIMLRLKLCNLQLYKSKL